MLINLEQSLHPLRSTILSGITLNGTEIPTQIIQSVCCQDSRSQRWQTPKVGGILPEKENSKIKPPTWRTYYHNHTWLGHVTWTPILKSCPGIVCNSLHIKSERYSGVYYKESLFSKPNQMKSIVDEEKKHIVGS